MIPAFRIGGAFSLVLVASCGARDVAPSAPADIQALVAPSRTRGGPALSSTDLASQLFPPSANAEPTATAAATPPTAPGREQAPSTSNFADDGFASQEDVSEAELVDVGDFCRRSIVRATAESVTREGGPGGTPTCREISLPVAFKGDATYRKLHAVRAFDGVARYSTLLLELDGGVAALPVSWDVDDPRDPGCPSIVRTVALDELRLQAGFLVVVSLGVDTTWVEVPDGSVDDGGARRRLRREILLVQADGATVHTRTFDPQYSSLGDELGEKVQPSMHDVPWTGLQWHGRHGFRIEAGGALKVL